MIAKIKRNLLVVCLGIFFYQEAHAQCEISSVSNQSGCSGTYTLSATSLSSNVTQHRWYDSQTGGAMVSTTNQFSPTSGVWVSQLESTFTQNTTYWVAAVCNGSENSSRTPVTFTLNQGSDVTIVLTPFQNPLDFCEGQTVTLTASGGTNPQWRFNSSTGDVISYSTSINPTQSGIYYLTAFNSCGIAITKDIPITFNQNLGTVSVNTPNGNFCQGNQTTTMFTASSANASSYTWSVSGTGNTISNGLVTWNPFFSGEATVTATAHGCNGTQLSGSKTITVFPLPDVTTTPSGTVIIPFGSEEVTLSTSSVAGYIYKWFFNGQPIFNGNTSTLVASREGEYRVTATDANNCSSNSQAINVVLENNHNYIITNTLQVDKKADGNSVTYEDVSTLSVDERQQQIEYFDGLGRSIQSVITQGSPDKKDIVQPIVYDQFGRETEKYLPYVSDEIDGWYKSDFVDVRNPLYTVPSSSPQYKFYQNTPMVAVDPMPYATTVFESSPLNRALKQGAPGEAWQSNGTDRVVKKFYEFNKEEEEYNVLNLQYDPETEGIVYDVVEKFYEPDQLFANRTLDEHDNEVIEYVDKQGKVLCKKVLNDIQGGTKLYAETYYVYDDFGNLVLVLQPEGVEKLKDTIGN